MGWYDCGKDKMLPKQRDTEFDGCTCIVFRNKFGLETIDLKNYNTTFSRDGRSLIINCRAKEGENNG